jgi:AAA+ ATPase superfamily predicted ATPase
MDYGFIKNTYLCEKINLMSIIGRNDEIEILDSLHSSSRSEFLAIYGRRRVGKTYLIRSFFEKYIVFEASGILNGTKEEQLENFWLNLKDHTQIKRQPKSWLKSFYYLNKYLDTLTSNKKKVIFLDEIAWFDNHKSGFLKALDSFWNTYCNKRNDIILIICGSAASWIIDKVIEDKGGLHNRVTHTIHLQPFSIGESIKYLNSNKVKLAQNDLLELYMITGGIPFYLNYVKPSKSLIEIINDLYCKSNAPLKDEFSKLYASLFKNYELHVAIIKALARKQSGMTREEIINKAKLKSSGHITEALAELEKCDFIIKLSPYQKKKVTTIYRLVDEFSRFYLDFIFNTGKTTGSLILNSQKYAVWTGYAFENFCYRHKENIANAIGIRDVNYNVFSFYSKASETIKGIQIDMLFDRADNCINILEIKYSKLAFEITKAYSNNLILKKEIFRLKTESSKNLFLTMIGNIPFKKNKYYLSVVDREIQLKEILK